MEEIEATYDDEFSLANSDQFYVGNVWGRQEYYRSKQAKVKDTSIRRPSDAQDPRKLPEGESPELHTTIDYDASLFQPMAFNQRFLEWIKFNGPSLSSLLKPEGFGASVEMFMPKTTANAFRRIFKLIPDGYPGLKELRMLNATNFGVNYAAEHIFAIWHCTGLKADVPVYFQSMWFYPYVRPLLLAIVKRSQEQKDADVIGAGPINGRIWKRKYTYPSKEDGAGDFGGSWSDAGPDNWSFVPWRDTCGQYHKNIFAGDALALQKAENGQTLEDSKKQ